MALIRVDWNPSDRKVRQFNGLLVLLIAFVSAMAWHKGNVAAAWRIAIIGAFVAGAGAAWLTFGRWVYRAWMSVAFVVGSVVSTILLFVLYYAILTPLGLLFRVLGRDALGLRGSAESYWVSLQIPEDEGYFERLY